MSILETLYSVVVAPEKFHIMSYETTYPTEKRLHIDFKRGCVYLVPIWNEETFRHMVLPKLVCTGLSGIEIGGVYQEVAPGVTLNIELGSNTYAFFNFKDTLSTILEQGNNGDTPTISSHN